MTPENVLTYFDTLLMLCKGHYLVIVPSSFLDAATGCFVSPYAKFSFMQTFETTLPKLKYFQVSSFRLYGAHTWDLNVGQVTAVKRCHQPKKAFIIASNGLPSSVTGQFVSLFWYIDLNSMSLYLTRLGVHTSRLSGRNLLITFGT